MNPDFSNNAADFRQLSLDSSLHRGIEAAGFVRPRPVQAATIPAALAGRDVLGLAQTGTGKTAAFALPIAQRLISEQRPGPRALIVAPTRELAMQIDAETRALAQFTRIKTVTIFGGVALGGQIRALKGRPDIIVACPGRLLDLMQQGFVDLSRIETLVLDEADHMFDMGFLPDIRKIIAALPAKRQNLMFSATMPDEIRKLADKVLRDPEVVELSHSMPAETIEHALYPVAHGRKFGLLQHLLGGDDFTSAIVFSRTKHGARKLAEQLSRGGHDAVALQGNMSQAQRDRAMKGFRGGHFNILVATDIAARGIDVAGVSHVINFDIPGTPDAYTHRIGRTGRSELSGKAYTLIVRDDAEQVRAIERRLGAKIERRIVEGFAAGPGEEPRYDHSSRGPRQGQGPRAGAGRAHAPGKPAQSPRGRNQAQGPRTSTGAVSETAKPGRVPQRGKQTAGPRSNTGDAPAGAAPAHSFRGRKQGQGQLANVASVPAAGKPAQAPKRRGGAGDGPGAKRRRQRRRNVA